MAWIQFDMGDDPNKPGSRECHSLTACGTKLYLFGGNDQNVRMNEIHAFDTGTHSARCAALPETFSVGSGHGVTTPLYLPLSTVTMKWANCKPTGVTPIPRSAHSMTLINETTMYTFGGWDGNEELGDLHAFHARKSNSLQQDPPCSPATATLKP